MPTGLRISCHALLIVVLVRPNFSWAPGLTPAKSSPVLRRPDTVPPPQSVTDRVTERRTDTIRSIAVTRHMYDVPAAWVDSVFSSFNSPGGRTIGSLYANDRFAVLTVFFNLVHSSVSIYTLLVSILFLIFFLYICFVCVEKCFVHLKHRKFRRFSIMCIADCSFHSEKLFNFEF